MLSNQNETGIIHDRHQVSQFVGDPAIAVTALGAGVGSVVPVDELPESLRYLNDQLPGHSLARGVGMVWRLRMICTAWARGSCSLSRHVEATLCAKSPAKPLLDMPLLSMSSSGMERENRTSTTRSGQ